MSILDMKIISGIYKGRIIEMPDGIRPTSDKVREALFEILKNRIEGAKFLDLYSGSGAVGIEALSRGAEKAVFVDNNRRCASILKANLAKLDISESSYEIYNKDCIDILCRGGFHLGAKHLDIQHLGARQTRPYDIVFLDPPYYEGLAKNTLIGLSSCDILAPDALIIAEVFKKEGLPEESGVFKKIRSSKYGDTLLEFFKK